MSDPQITPMSNTVDTMSEQREMSLQDQAKLERLTEQLKANINHAMTPVADAAFRRGLLEAAAICRELEIAPGSVCAAAIERRAKEQP